ncbi:RICIN domain-containing protein [Couchioplanes caeruleus]|nr:ricin-type beta-trefoil lectin domain protein [Couchioplanes caeruleus]ROP28195.1 ricin-type beta-trefoil lectin protein [Couchioplanes caeruleus]
MKRILSLITTVVLASGVAVALSTMLTGPAAATPAPGPIPRTVERAQASAFAGIQLRNANSNLCLVSRAGSGERPVVQSTCANPPTYWADQYWEYIYPDRLNNPGYVRVRNVALGLCLTARGAAETAAVTTTCGSGWAWPDQIWRLTYVPRWNADRIQNLSSGNCLAARGSGESLAVVTTCNDGWIDQHWR